MIDNRHVVNEDIKRILIDRDITTIKQAFYRILCSEIRNNGPQMKEEIERRVLNTAKEQQSALLEQTGIEPSLTERDMK